MVDLGVTFAEGDDLPGIDLILPDIRFLEPSAASIVGIVLTHAHEDHFGALFDLWPRLQRAGLCDAVHRRPARSQAPREPNAPDIDVRIVPLGGRITIGPFDVEFVLGGAFDSRIQRARDPHAGRHRAAYRRLEDRPDRRSSAGRPTRRAARSSARRACSPSIGDSTNAVRDGRSPSEADVARHARRS